MGVPVFPPQAVNVITNANTSAKEKSCFFMGNTLLYKSVLRLLQYELLSLNPDPSTIGILKNWIGVRQWNTRLTTK